MALLRRYDRAAALTGVARVYAINYGLYCYGDAGRIPASLADAAGTPRHFVVFRQATHLRAGFFTPLTPPILPRIGAEKIEK